MINDSEAKLLFVSQAYADMVEPIGDRLTTVLPNGLINLDYDGDGRDSFTSFIESAPSDDCRSIDLTGVGVQPNLQLRYYRHT
jgi:hypothetical protein